MSTTGLARFQAARGFLLEHREDYDGAYAGFRWPELDEFNWALEWFDHLGADPESAQRPALWIVEQDGSERKWTFAEMSARSNQVANWLRSLGV
ncbi:MAG: acyl-CoA synthetase, partial [Pseudonocardia sp.]|nr:acyl-CoA synthetase [Pseudonocardia sp.]